MQGKERVDRATLSKAAREVFHLERRRDLVRPLLVILILVLGGLLAVTLYQLEPRNRNSNGACDRGKSPLRSPWRARREAAANEAKPATALPDTLEWPAGEPRSRSKALAYAALFRAWGADYKEGGDACRRLKAWVCAAAPPAADWMNCVD